MKYNTFLSIFFIFQDFPTLVFSRHSVSWGTLRKNGEQKKEKNKEKGDKRKQKNTYGQT